MLNYEHVTITYDGREVVRDFNLVVPTGEIVSIVGESGSGKTTVIRAAMGLLPRAGKVASGSIYLDHVNLTALSEKEWLPFRGEHISMIFQDAGAMMNPIVTIGKQFIETIRTHHEEMSEDEARELALTRLKEVNLADPERVMNAYTFELSGGMRQRVGIAMAMSFNPELLLADEPTSALDVTTQAQIVRRMIKLNRAHKDHQSIIIVTHNLGVAAYMSDRIVVMKDGIVMETGTRDDILYHAKDPYTKRLLSAVPTMAPRKGA